LAIPLLVLAIAAPLVQAVLSAAQASFPHQPESLVTQIRLRGLTFFLYAIQPLARLCGRLRNGLHPWRQRGARDLSMPWPGTFSIWREQWQAAGTRLQALEESLRADGSIVLAGGAYDRWDLEIQGGLLGAVRTRIAIEEHGAGKQMLRFRVWPRCSLLGVLITLVFAVLASAAGFDRDWDGCATLAAMTLVPASRMFYECAVAMTALARGLKQMRERGE
jgi:hypothetical protein